MNKLSKIYLINIGGTMKSIKALSKKQICQKLDISLYQINFDCEIFSLEEWKEIKDNKIDIYLVDEEDKVYDLDFKEALKNCIDGKNIQNIEYPKDYFLIFNGRGFEDSSGCELNTYDFCGFKKGWRAF
ncbi:hypothetical protein ACNSOL_11580 (plasmid) [Aliarcobacter lanthieri]|uniref:hypothetical protein n=1 Tax=Aliarcobacter lanthieri TaxID=1355374 RepID=UPI003AAFA239